MLGKNICRMLALLIAVCFLLPVGVIGSVGDVNTGKNNNVVMPDEIGVNTDDADVMEALSDESIVTNTDMDVDDVMPVDYMEEMLEEKTEYIPIPRAVTSPKGVGEGYYPDELIFYGANMMAMECRNTTGEAEFVKILFAPQGQVFTMQMSSMYYDSKENVSSINNVNYGVVDDGIMYNDSFTNVDLKYTISTRVNEYIILDSQPDAWLVANRQDVCFESIIKFNTGIVLYANNQVYDYGATFTTTSSIEFKDADNSTFYQIYPATAYYTNGTGVEKTITGSYKVEVFDGSVRLVKIFNLGSVNDAFIDGATSIMFEPEVGVEVYDNTLAMDINPVNGDKVFVGTSGTDIRLRVVDVGHNTTMDKTLGVSLGGWGIWSLNVMYIPNATLDGVYDIMVTYNTPDWGFYAGRYDSVTGDLISTIQLASSADKVVINCVYGRFGVVTSDKNIHIAYLRTADWLPYYGVLDYTDLSWKTGFPVQMTTPNAGNIANIILNHDSNDNVFAVYNRYYPADEIHTNKYNITGSLVVSNVTVGAGNVYGADSVIDNNDNLHIFYSFHSAGYYDYYQYSNALELVVDRKTVIGLSGVATTTPYVRLGTPEEDNIRLYANMGDGITVKYAKISLVGELVGEPVSVDAGLIPYPICITGFKTDNLYRNYVMITKYNYAETLCYYDFYDSLPEEVPEEKLPTGVSAARAGWYVNGLFKILEGPTMLGEALIMEERSIDTMSAELVLPADEKLLLERAAAVCTEGPMLLYGIQFPKPPLGVFETPDMLAKRLASISVTFEVDRLGERARLNTMWSDLAATGGDFEELGGPLTDTEEQAHVEDIGVCQYRMGGWEHAPVLEKEIFGTSVSVTGSGWTRFYSANKLYVAVKGDIPIREVIKETSIEAIYERPAYTPDTSYDLNILTLDKIDATMLGVNLNAVDLLPEAIGLKAEGNGVFQDYAEVLGGEELRLCEEISKTPIAKEIVYPDLWWGRAGPATLEIQAIGESGMMNDPSFVSATGHKSTIDIMVNNRPTVVQPRFGTADGDLYTFKAALIGPEGSGANVKVREKDPKGLLPDNIVKEYTLMQQAATKDVDGFNSRISEELYLKPEMQYCLEATYIEAAEAPKGKGRIAQTMVKMEIEKWDTKVNAEGELLSARVCNVKRNQIALDSGNAAWKKDITAEVAELRMYHRANAAVMMSGSKCLDRDGEILSHVFSEATAILPEMPEMNTYLAWPSPEMGDKQVKLTCTDDLAAVSEAALEVNIREAIKEKCLYIKQGSWLEFDFYQNNATADIVSFNYDSKVMYDGTIVNVTVINTNLSDDAWDYCIIGCWYNESILPAGIDESQLRMYYYSADTGKLELCPESWVDTELDMVYGKVTHFSFFLIGESPDTAIPIYVITGPGNETYNVTSPSGWTGTPQTTNILLIVIVALAVIMILVWVATTYKKGKRW